jgi:Fe-S cluster assembly iron-binding protein IscA
MVRGFSLVAACLTVSLAYAEPCATDLAPPSEWRVGGEVKSADGRQSVTISELFIPVDTDLDGALDRAVGLLRKSLTETLAARLGALQHQRTGSTRMALWEGTNAKKTEAYWFGAVALPMPKAPPRGLALMFTDLREPHDARCTEAAGRAMVESLAAVALRVPRAPTTGKLVSPVFTEAAATELRRTRTPGQMVWLGVDRTGPTGFDYVLELRSESEVAATALRYRQADLPVGMDHKDLPLLAGSTIDYIAGKGFKFNNPNAR